MNRMTYLGTSSFKSQDCRQRGRVKGIHSSHKTPVLLPYFMCVLPLTMQLKRKEKISCRSFNCSMDFSSICRRDETQMKANSEGGHRLSPACQLLPYQPTVILVLNSTIRNSISCCLLSTGTSWTCFSCFWNTKLSAHFNSDLSSLKSRLGISTMGCQGIRGKFWILSLPPLYSSITSWTVLTDWAVWALFKICFSSRRRLNIISANWIWALGKACREKEKKSVQFNCFQ